MILTIKLTMFGYNVYDGYALGRDDSGHPRILDPSLPKERQLYSRVKWAIRELPSPLEYAGYVCFFPTVLTGRRMPFVSVCRLYSVCVCVGPAWEYMYYIRVIRGSLHSTVPVAVGHRLHSLPLPALGCSAAPSSAPAVAAWVRPWAQSVLCLGMYMALEKRFHIRYLTAAAATLSPGVYHGLSWSRRLGYVWTTVLGERQ